MTWQEACKKSPHGMGIRVDETGGRRREKVCTRHGDVLVRGGLIPREVGFRFQGDGASATLLGLADNWEPLTGRDPAAPITLIDLLLLADR